MKLIMDKKENKFLYWGITILTLIVLIVAIVIGVMVNNKNKELELPYTELITKMSENKVEKVEMTTGSQSIKVKFLEEEDEKNCIVPSIQAFIELVQKKVVEEGLNDIELIQKGPNPVKSIAGTLFSLLPTIMIVALFVLILQMQGLNFIKERK